MLLKKKLLELALAILYLKKLILLFYKKLQNKIISICKVIIIFLLIAKPTVKLIKLVKKNDQITILINKQKRYKFRFYYILAFCFFIYR